MDKNTILYWYEKYNREEDPKDKFCEKELGRKLRKSKELSKDDFIRLLRWKFSTYPARLKRELNLVDRMSDSFIRTTIRDALESEDESTRIERLIELKGVKNAVASVILTFYDPKNYGIFDIHAWRELFGKEPKGFSSQKSCLVKFLTELRKMAVEYQLDVRMVEKALFKKHYDESKDSI